MEDLELIICTGANIRLSTMALSVLNYGYAIVRNTIIRDLVCAGFYPAIGIPHEGPFNGFNLADDLIEPWRAMVDVVRILILLNPTNKRGTKAAYTELRKFLVKDGYILLQSEVFMRITNNRKGAEKHLNRIKSYIPDTGTVRIMRLTEKQYCNMGLYQAEEDYQESIVGANDFVML